MHHFNHSFIPPRSSADMNQSSNPSRPVSLVPTRPTPFESGCVDFNQHQTGFMNLLNQPLSWDPNLYGWNPNQNMDGMGHLKHLDRHKHSARHYASPMSFRIHNRK
ncbi:hypothetical protein Hanom_Chr01g00015201 [Helianthus anomalus]